MRPRRIRVMCNGTECYFPILCRYRTITHVGPSFKHWQSAMAKGRQMAKEELEQRKQKGPTRED